MTWRAEPLLWFGAAETAIIVGVVLGTDLRSVALVIVLVVVRAGFAFLTRRLVTPNPPDAHHRYKPHLLAWLGVAEAVVACVVVFGPDLSPGQVAGVLGLSHAVFAAVGRHFVTPSPPAPT